MNSMTDKKTKSNIFNQFSSPFYPTRITPSYPILEIYLQTDFLFKQDVVIKINLLNRILKTQTYSTVTSAILSLFDFFFKYQKQIDVKIRLRLWENAFVPPLLLIFDKKCHDLLERDGFQVRMLTSDTNSHFFHIKAQKMGYPVLPKTPSYPNVPYKIWISYM